MSSVNRTYDKGSGIASGFQQDILLADLRKNNYQFPDLKQHNRTEKILTGRIGRPMGLRITVAFGAITSGG